jgi:hypothetical protein
VRFAGLVFWRSNSGNIATLVAIRREAWKLRKIRRNPPRLIFAEQFGR